MRKEFITYDRAIDRKQWNWHEQRDKHAFLALEDGSILRGYSVGASVDQCGEIIFNTGMTGYQEILTDPSYKGQFVTMTYPEIGNTGINEQDAESHKIFLNGLIIHSLNQAENWRSQESLGQYLIRHKIPAIAGIDTRRLTNKIREHGNLKAFLSMTGGKNETESIAMAQNWEGIDNQDYLSQVTCNTAYTWDVDLDQYWGLTKEIPPINMHIIAYDFGIKWNILRKCRCLGIMVTVVPAYTAAEIVLKQKPDAVLLSNGPGDPSSVPYAINTAKTLLSKIPLFGICLGHQILAIACGARTYRLKFGHHGSNHPVKVLETGKVKISSQNHNFAVDQESIKPLSLEVTHVNLNDYTIEGFRHKREPVFSIQYHPEAGPGPHDSDSFFQEMQHLVARV